MEALDGDGAPLYSNRLRRYRERDIVQFVPFSALKRDPILLAKEVMAEIPRQLTDFFQNKNIVPNPKAFQDRQGLLIRNKMRNQMAMMMGKQNNVGFMKKAQMIQNMVQMGFNQD